MKLPATPDEEVDALLMLAGLRVPPELRAGVASEVRDLRGMAALLRSNRLPSAEPSNIFRLAPPV